MHRGLRLCAARAARAPRGGEGQLRRQGHSSGIVTVVCVSPLVLGAGGAGSTGCLYLGASVVLHIPLAVGVWVERRVCPEVDGGLRSLLLLSTIRINLIEVL